MKRLYVADCHSTVVFWADDNDPLEDEAKDAAREDAEQNDPTISSISPLVATDVPGEWHEAIPWGQTPEGYVDMTVAEILATEEVPHA